METTVKLVNDRFLAAADRGYIYEFLETTGEHEGKYCVVVSSQKRAYDKLVSILMLGDSRAGYDVVKFGFQGEIKYVHAGLVTYARRDRLGKRICPFPKKALDTVDLLMANELGLESEKGMIYKTLYDELIRTFMKGGDHE